MPQGPLSARLRAALRAVHHRFAAKTAHSLHSPFVYELYCNTLADHSWGQLPEVERLRGELLKDSSAIEVHDFGAGSRKGHRQRRVDRMARTSLKPPKLVALLYRLSDFLAPKNVVELGTSLGLTTLYLAEACPQATIHTFEGCPNTAAWARQHFQWARAENIHLHQGPLADTLPAFLASAPEVDLAFVDAHHRKAPTLAFFRQLWPHTSPEGLLVFDDIYWSAEMEAAWRAIAHNPEVPLSIDLYWMGLVFKSFSAPKQHFRLRL